MKNGSKYDVIVIGSGIGGTTPAILLAKYFNKRVLIIEKHWQFGGLTHGFDVDGKTFSPGVHYIGGVNNGSIPDKLFDIITGSKLKWLPMPYRYDFFHLPGFQYAFPASPDQLVSELSKDFPSDTRAIKQFIKDTRKAFWFLSVYTSLRSFAPWVLRGLIPLIRGFLGFNPNESLRKYLDKRFTNQTLKDLLSAQWMDHGVLPSEASFMVHAMIFQHYLRGAYYPEGGPSSVNKGMKETLEKYNVSVKLNTEVLEILTRKNKAYGVKLKEVNGQELEIYSPYIISNAGALNTYKNLLSQHSFTFIEKDAKHLSPEYTFFSIYVSLHESPKILGFDGANHWVFNRINLKKDMLSPSHPSFPGFYCMTFPSLKANDHVNHKVEIMTMVNYAAFSPWKDQGWKQRDHTYYTLKDRITTLILHDIEKRFPGFMDLIAEYDSSSPLTMEKFVNRDKGASYGVPYSTQRMKMKWLSNRTLIGNLYLSGQDTLGPGVMAAMMGGVGAAAKVLGVSGYMKIMKRVLKHIVKAQTLYYPTVIKGIKNETPDAFTLVFEPCDHINHRYEAGQFILLNVFIEGKYVKRAYSLSSSKHEKYPSITVKRIKNGLMSNFLGDRIVPGNIIQTSAPRGKFTIPKRLDEKDILLVAAGSGITPVFALLKDILAGLGNNKIHLIYASKTPETTIFKDQLDLLSVSHSANLKIDYFFSQGTSANRLDPEKLQTIISQYSLENMLVNICAPEGFTYMVWDKLQELNFNPDNFRYESFTTKGLNIHKVNIPSVDAKVVYQVGKEEHQVKVSKELTLLEGLLEHQVPIEHSCMNGDCELCSCKILNGEVVSLRGKDTQKHKLGDIVLPCISYGASEAIGLEKLH